MAQSQARPANSLRDWRTQIKNNYQYINQYELDFVMMAFFSQSQKACNTVHFGNRVPWILSSLSSVSLIFPAPHFLLPLHPHSWVENLMKLKLCVSYVPNGLLWGKAVLNVCTRRKTSTKAIYLKRSCVCLCTCVSTKILVCNCAQHLPAKHIHQSSSVQCDSWRPK